MTKSEQIFKIIHKKCQAEGISERDLACTLGCSERSVAYWRNGKRQINLNNADKALKALGIAVRIGAPEGEVYEIEEENETDV